MRCNIRCVYESSSTRFEYSAELLRISHEFVCMYACRVICKRE